jgi:hypothetical protein
VKVEAAGNDASAVPPSPTLASSSGPAHHRDRASRSSRSVPSTAPLASPAPSPPPVPVVRLLLELDPPPPPRRAPPPDRGRAPLPSFAPVPNVRLLPTTQARPAPSSASSSIAGPRPSSTARRAGALFSVGTRKNPELAMTASAAVLRTELPASQATQLEPASPRRCPPLRRRSRTPRPTHVATLHRVAPPAALRTAHVTLPHAATPARRTRSSVAAEAVRDRWRASGS